MSINEGSFIERLSTAVRLQDAGLDPLEFDPTLLHDAQATIEKIQMQGAEERSYRAGFIDACRWPSPVSQDVDSPAFAEGLEQHLAHNS